jgi:hypothetical protein
MDRIFSKIYHSLPSEGRPSRYITMTSSAGKISLLGKVKMENGKDAFALKFNEARNMKWMDQAFLAVYDEEENTIEKLIPYDTDKYFFEDELKEIENTLQDNFDMAMSKQLKVVEPVEVD